jgi:hypothetical protein
VFSLQQFSHSEHAGVRVSLTERVALMRDWEALDPSMARTLVDARLQLHHAVQLATAVGISYLVPQPDDSHTNLEWLDGSGALASRRVNAPMPFRIAVRPGDLSLLILEADDTTSSELTLSDNTLLAAAQWVRKRISEHGAESARYTLSRHYNIPEHSVDAGAPFVLEPRARFEELSRWFADADLLLRALAAHTPGASEVRCWPHHFDIAAIITISDPTDGEAWSIGLGLEPGDEYYAEPYLYVTANPPPARPTLSLLSGGGRWHTHQWFGAVLLASDLPSDVRQQRSQAETFLSSAVAACRAARLTATP